MLCILLSGLFVFLQNKSWLNWYTTTDYDEARMKQESNKNQTRMKEEHTQRWKRGLLSMRYHDCHDSSSHHVYSQLHSCLSNVERNEKEREVTWTLFSFLVSIFNSLVIVSSSGHLSFLSISQTQVTNDRQSFWRISIKTSRKIDSSRRWLGYCGMFLSIAETEWTDNSEYSGSVWCTVSCMQNIFVSYTKDVTEIVSLVSLIAWWQ